jgi:signal transduction histidine kinase
MAPHKRLARRLAFTTLLPVSMGIFIFCVLAERRAQSLLEDELGRRLAMSAVAIAVQILPEQVKSLSAGDEGSRTFAHVHHKLQEGQSRFGLRRVMILSQDSTSRGDSLGRVALGSTAHEVSADSLEIQLAESGRPTASPLFTGHDRLLYKRAYAAIGDSASVAGVVMVEGNATYYESMRRFRTWLFLGGGGLLLILVVAVVLVGQRMTGPIGRLAFAADRIGRGELNVPVAKETNDEIGVLAERFDEMRRALAARDERMQMMLAGIAHEVRNPLGGLELFVGLLREGLQGQPDRLDEVKSLQREVSYLGDVVTEFLDYARRPVLTLSTLELQPLLNEVKQVAGVDAQLVSVLVAPALVVKADEGQLRRVLLNLVRNALQAAPKGPVVLEAKRTDGRVVIEVRDGGSGVPEELKEKIFDPFFTTRQKGTGLGLAFARDIVVEHKGSLTVHTAAEGGACFRITL